MITILFVCFSRLLTGYFFIAGGGRALAHEARNEAAEFHLMWGYEMPPHVLAQW